MQLAQVIPMWNQSSGTIPPTKSSNNIQVKTITARVTSFSLVGAKVVRDDIEVLTGTGTVKLVSTKKGLNHTITVNVPDERMARVRTILSSWKWKISEPKNKTETK